MYMYCIKKDTKSWNWGDIEMKQEKLKILIIIKKNLCIIYIIKIT